jgi:hypothetical protein
MLYSLLNFHIKFEISKDAASFVDIKNKINIRQSSVCDWPSRLRLIPNNVRFLGFSWSNYRWSYYDYRLRNASSGTDPSRRRNTISAMHKPCRYNIFLEILRTFHNCRCKYLRFRILYYADRVLQRRFNTGTTLLVYWSPSKPVFSYLKTFSNIRFVAP